MDDTATIPLIQKSTARLAAVQALYQTDFLPERTSQLAEDYLQGRLRLDVENGIADFDKELFVDILRAVATRLGDIDPMLEANLDSKWPIARLEKILKGILRAGVAELLEHATIDKGIIINDYVNVAHGFFEGKEPALVNAVLDKIARHVRS